MHAQVLASRVSRMLSGNKTNFVEHYITFCDQQIFSTQRDTVQGNAKDAQKQQATSNKSA